MYLLQDKWTTRTWHCLRCRRSSHWRVRRMWSSFSWMLRQRYSQLKFSCHFLILCMQWKAISFSKQGQSHESLLKAFGISCLFLYFIDAIYAYYMFKTKKWNSKTRDDVSCIDVDEEDALGSWLEKMLVMMLTLICSDHWRLMYGQLKEDPLNNISRIKVSMGVFPTSLTKKSCSMTWELTVRRDGNLRRSFPNRVGWFGYWVRQYSSSAHWDFSWRDSMWATSVRPHASVKIKNTHQQR